MDPQISVASDDRPPGGALPSAGDRRAADRRFYVFAGVFSALAVALIAWLLLGRSATPSAGGVDLSFMPPVNAALNAAAATLLTLGWLAVRRGDRALHMRLMIAAFAMSSLFLLGYLAYHYVHGDTKYPVGVPGRTPYLVLLASHVLLSLPVVPLSLVAFYLAWRKDFSRHRRVTRWLAPIWLYVSVTGVVVYLVLRAAVGYQG
jgi:putative membrane protein